LSYIYSHDMQNNHIKYSRIFDLVLRDQIMLSLECYEYADGSKKYGIGNLESDIIRSLSSLHSVMTDIITIVCEGHYRDNRCNFDSILYYMLDYDDESLKDLGDEHGYMKSSEALYETAFTDQCGADPLIYIKWYDIGCQNEVMKTMDGRHMYMGHMGNKSYIIPMVIALSFHKFSLMMND
jgi:hypothetical protein